MSARKRNARNAANAPPDSRSRSRQRGPWPLCRAPGPRKRAHQTGRSAGELSRAVCPAGQRARDCGPPARRSAGAWP
jgi:hypothetical protein